MIGIHVFQFYLSFILLEVCIVYSLKLFAVETV